MGSIATRPRLDREAVVREKRRDKKSAMVQYLAQEFRVKVLDVLHDRGTGHWGGAASAAELLVGALLRCDEHPARRSEVAGSRSPGGEQGTCLVHVVHGAGQPRATSPPRSWPPSGCSTADYRATRACARSKRRRWRWRGGRVPFDEILQILADIGYDGYLTVEILPKPDPDQAAAQAAKYLLRKLGRGLQ